MPFFPPARCAAWFRPRILRVAGPAGVLAGPRARLLASLLTSLFAAVAAGCSTPKPVVYSLERFDAVSQHARSYGLTAAQTCDAARRALLSHGYLVQRFTSEQVDGRKSFQPSSDVHVEIEFHVVCATVGAERSTVFVNALQDRYAIKKTSGSASLGVGPLGSVSLPFWSSSDSMVKIASETIPSGEFYDRFFALIEHQLSQVEMDPADDPAHAILPALVTVPPTQPPAHAPGEAVTGGDSSPPVHRTLN